MTEQIETKQELKDTKEFLDLLNRRGFILENKLYKFISTTAIKDLNGFERNKYFKLGEDEYEIDVILKTKRYYAFFECKKTIYSWIFSKINRSANMILLTYKPRSQLDFHYEKREEIMITDSSLALGIDETGNLIKNTKKDVSSSMNNIEEAIRQVLSNIDAYLVSQSKSIHFADILPVIVTNAPLYILEYNDKDINEKGDLEKIEKMQKVPFLAVNISYAFSFPTGNPYEKTVFIVNIKNLPEFIKFIEETLFV